MIKEFIKRIKDVVSISLIDYKNGYMEFKSTTGQQVKFIVPHSLEVWNLIIPIMQEQLKKTEKPYYWELTYDVKKREFILIQQIIYAVLIKKVNKCISYIAIK